MEELAGILALISVSGPDRRRRRLSASALVTLATARGRHVALMPCAQSVARAHRCERGAQTAKAGECRLEIRGARIEVPAAAAVARGAATHCASRFQNASNTWVESR